MKAIVTGLILLFYTLDLSGQILNFYPPEISTSDPVFNQPFIYKHKIKKIISTQSTKKDGEPILTKGLCKGYEFDSLGRLAKFFYTEVKEHKEAEGRHAEQFIYDTLFTNFYYDTLGRMVIKRNLQGTFYYTHYYEYGADGIISKELYCRETNANPSPYNFKLGAQIIISSETFTYLKTGVKQLKKICMNDENRVYRIAMMNFDDRGYKISEDYEYAVTWVRQLSAFKYDSLSNIIERTYTSTAGGEISEKDVFIYEGKNVSIQKKHRNNILLQEINYLYDENKELLKTEVTRLPQENAIGIVKYEYFFYAN